MDPPLPTTAGAGSTTVGDDEGGEKMDSRLKMSGMTEREIGSRETMWGMTGWEKGSRQTVQNERVGYNVGLFVMRQPINAGRRASSSARYSGSVG